MSIKYRYVGMKLAHLTIERDLWNQYPKCQRDYVWQPNMQRKLVDSILRGLAIPPVTVFASEHQLLGQIYYIVDGQQRIKTILKYVDGEFATAQKFRDEPLISPICPGKRYSELDQGFKKQYDQYELQVCFIEGVEGKDIELVYRRMNYQVSLNFSERLYSYQSPTRKFAEPLLDHPFWSDVYIGKDDRKQIYQMSLMALLMEHREVFCNMTTPRLLDIAAGSVGNIEDMTQEVSNRIYRRLSLAQNLFLGADMRAMSQFIPLYQAIMLLEEDGYDLANAPKGCFSTWFNKLRANALQSQRSGYGDIFAIITKVHEQQKFWTEHLPVLQSTNGLIQRDQKRKFAVYDKLQAWIRQEGKCGMCGKMISTRSDAHHIKLHSNGGKTNHDNCMLVHQRCHTEQHQKEMQL